MTASCAPPASHPAHASSRIFGLDLLRAFSLLVILYLHGFSITLQPWPSIPYIDLDAVTLFFVLSGFLIGGILLRQLEDGPTARGLLRFWVARWMRTLPAYVAALLLISLAWVRLGGTALPPEWSRYWWFGQNLAWAHPVFFGEAWSLTVEEWFYLGIPLAAFVAVGALKWPARRVLPALAVATILASWAVRMGMHAAHPDLTYEMWDALLRKQVITRMDSLMWGILAAWAWTVHGERARRWAVPCSIAGATGLVWVVVTPWTQPIQRTWLVLTLMPACVALLMPLLASMKRGPRFLAPGVAFISRISYSVYLLHASLVMNLLAPAVARLKPDVLDQPAVRYALYWSLSFGLGWLMWRTVEVPFMKLRDICLARLTSVRIAPAVRKAPVQAPLDSRSLRDSDHRFERASQDKEFA